MKFVLANWGSRGEIEPCAAVGLELQRRGHEVCIAVPPDLVGFVESAGVSTVAYGLEFEQVMDIYRDFWTYFFRNFWKVHTLGGKWREVAQPLLDDRVKILATLRSLTEGADVLVTGMNYEDIAANVAESRRALLAALHYFPMRANGQVVSFLPAPVGRQAMKMFWWLCWRGPKKIEDAERRELGLPKATQPWTKRIADRGTIEIQAYDTACFPGLAAEWEMWAGQRPFVGTLTMNAVTDTDAEVLSWIAAGTPPVCFGFGSLPVESPAETMAMIRAVCSRLGERALVCAAATEFSENYQSHAVKIVRTMNYAEVFPYCRAAVHHGGAGTTAASFRAGIPTLVLWTGVDQRVWGVQAKRLGVGATRRFAATDEKSLTQDLRMILAPQYLARARELAIRMSTPADSVAAAADLLEDFAVRKRVGSV